MPGRVPIQGWRYRMEPKGEAAAIEGAAKMTAESIDMTGPEWKEGCTALVADSDDVARIAVSVVDEKGRLVPTADNLVLFSVTGPGRIIGVGNGDSSSHEPDKAQQRSAFHGLCMVLVQTTGATGEIKLKAESDGLKHVVCSISAK